jgi:ethanolamine utilization microcompartment shell protein EutS
MPDFPIQAIADDALCTFHSLGPETLLGQFANAIKTAAAATAWTTANTAIFIPITLQTSFLAQKMAVNVTTQAGNLDVGIYDEYSNRLVSKGSTAVAAAGLQVIDIADTLLTPGTYYIAMNCDSVTAAFIAISPVAQIVRTKGCRQQAVGAIALPNPATFAVVSATRAWPAVAVAGVSVI